jgi:hypothetical protein
MPPLAALAQLDISFWAELQSMSAFVTVLWATTPATVPVSHALLIVIGVVLQPTALFALVTTICLPYQIKQNVFRTVLLDTTRLHSSMEMENVDFAIQTA